MIYDETDHEAAAAKRASIVAKAERSDAAIAAAACSEAARLYKLAADQGGMLAGSSIRGLAGICCHGTAARQPWAVRRLASIR
jgi:hypothetical protein